MALKWTFNPFTGNMDATQDPAEAIAHADLSDMPDVGGTNTDHDARYYTESEVDTLLGGYVPQSLADAANDFIVASGDDTFVKKTLAETGAILETDIDHNNIVNTHDLTTDIDHDTITNGGAHDYAYITGNDGDTDVTAAQLETLSDGSNADTLHVHGAAGITLLYDDIGNPDANSTIAFAGYTNTWTSTLNGGSVLTISNTTADVTSDTFLLDLKYADDYDVNAHYIRCVNNAGTDDDTVLEFGVASNDGFMLQFDSSVAFRINQAGASPVFTVDTTDDEIDMHGKCIIWDHLQLTDNPTYFYDSNDNEGFSLNSVASAVNYLEIANASTANGIELNATGSDTDIDVEVNPKGDGGLVVAGATGTVSTFGSGIIINEDGDSIDTRIESDTDTHMFFVDASANKIGISITNPEEQLHIQDNLKVGGNIITPGSGYLSITTTADSTASSAEYDIFDEDNYTAYGYDSNVTADGITYTQSNGRLTVNADGIYIIIINMILNISSSGTVTFKVKDNGTAFYSHTMQVHSSVDPVERSITVMRSLSEDDYINVTIDSASGNLSAYDGTSINMYKLK